MNIRLSLIILIFILASCGETNTSDNVTVLLNQSGNDEFRYGEMNTWKPNQSEINLPEKIIPRVLKDYNTDYNDTKISVNVNDYYYQLVPYLDNNDRKIIYVNSLCKSFVQNPVPSLNGTDEKKEIGWKSHLFIVEDGGECFWQVQIDIEKEEYFGFSINAN